MSESVYESDKKCSSNKLFRLQPPNNPSITKAMCKQECNANVECNFYAYWSEGLGTGDCRGWTTCPTLDNLVFGFKNTVYRVERSSAGALSGTTFKINK